MKYDAEIDGSEHRVEVTHGDGTVSAIVEGREYELEVSRPEAGVHLFSRKGRIFEAFVSAPDAAGERTVRVKNAEFRVRVFDPKRLRGGNANPSDGAGSAEIRTAMPGKVVRILAAVGDKVEKGDPVIVVEAMKMQNEMKSPKAGTIAAVHFQEGSIVAAGDVLAAIE